MIANNPYSKKWVARKNNPRLDNKRHAKKEEESKQRNAKIEQQCRNGSGIENIIMTP
jgi:hypothetical protein